MEWYEALTEHEREHLKDILLQRRIPFTEAGLLRYFGNTPEICYVCRRIAIKLVMDVYNPYWFHGSIQKDKERGEDI